MKSLALVLSYLSAPLRQRNTRVLAWLVALLVVMIVAFTVVFHLLMTAEGRDHSWFTGFYWTLTVMSTLGFGDITFTSDAGRVFTVVVLASGALFFLVLLPFTFIQFVFMPWMAHREASRAPRKLPEGSAGHILLTNLSEIEVSLIRHADGARVPYVLVVADLTEALRLHDQGYKVMVGDLDDPATYRAARVEGAALVATTRSDTENTNIVFTIREMDAHVPISATASSSASVDILDLAGCDHVMRLGQMLGDAMALRILGADARTHVIGGFDDLLIAEASPARTPIEGMTLREAGLRDRFGITVVGVWQRGAFELAGPETRLGAKTTLILAGSKEQMRSYDDAFAMERAIDAPVVIIGGGRVGRAAGEMLGREGIDYRIIEQKPERVRDPERYVLGDAAELEVLKEAGLEEAAAVLVTTHADDVNVYLTLYCRRLEPDIQIISRANLDRNVSTLHRAGADAVLSYASLGASAIWNTLGRSDTLVVAEGLRVFRVPVPGSMAGRSLAQSDIRRRTGCNVVALDVGDVTITNLDASTPLPADAELVIIGDAEAEQRFFAELANR